MTWIWLGGIVRRLGARLSGTIIGVALTVALIGTLGSQIAASGAAMTRQAIAAVSVDWQIQMNHGVAQAGVLAALAAATPYTVIKRVHYADVTGFEYSSASGTQTTGAGKVVGLESGYAQAFPAEIRWNIGAQRGVLLFQQTAANLHATVGDTITVKRVLRGPVRMRVDGIIAMPNIDSFFQSVGLPAGAAPQAPPDNVALIPESSWRTLFDPQTVVRPASTLTQLHVRVDRETLPGDPLAALSEVTARRKNVEARIAGSGIIGDNLSARLLSAQADALYARVLFLFLGAPGVALAILLTFAVAAAGAGRRAQEQALLRLRGAAAVHIVRLAGIEALVVAVGGTVLGTAGTIALRGATLTQAAWIVAAACIGVVCALAAVVAPALLLLRTSSVAQARAAIGRSAAPLWERLYADLILLAVAAAVFGQSAGSGYQVVLAPEGIPQASVHYEAFIAPLFVWAGGTLLAARLLRGVLLHPRRPFRVLLAPIAQRLSAPVAAWLGRQHRLVVRGMLLSGLAFAFGVSTAVFNATYVAQSRVDAQLTNGADVRVSGSTLAPPSRILSHLRSTPGVLAAQPMMHRYAFVGNDLQDIYGIDPRSIGEATPMSDAFFGNGNASATLAALAANQEGVLVSEETVQTYQLHIGDPIMLRLQDARTHRFIPIPFHFAGVTREFPTAPKDSFLVANAGYIARKTGSAAAETILIRVRPGAIGAVREAAQRAADPVPGVTVTTIEQAQAKIGSSLTAVDLHALTVIELLFAAVFVACATGLILALGFAERLRTFAILRALGAQAAHLRAFLMGEAMTIVFSGALMGIVLGFAIAQLLVKVLTGVFDPPPEALVVPWPYILALILAAAASSTVAVAIVVQRSSGAAGGALRML